MTEEDKNYIDWLSRYEMLSSEYLDKYPSDKNLLKSIGGNYDILKAIKIVSQALDGGGRITITTSGEIDQEEIIIEYPNPTGE